jgi:hypothetical protein
MVNWGVVDIVRSRVGVELGDEEEKQKRRQVFILDNDLGEGGRNDLDLGFGWFWLTTKWAGRRKTGSGSVPELCRTSLPKVSPVQTTMCYPIR